jgi:tellurite methyltransferase
MPQPSSRALGSSALVTRAADAGSAASWTRYYRWTAKRPPRELLLQTLNHIAWEGRRGRSRTAVDLGFGAGTDTLELVKRGWNVVAIDGQKAAARFLARRIPRGLDGSLTCLVAPMEGLELPTADLVYASFSLPFCAPSSFPALWSTIRRSLRPGGHFAGQLFGDADDWRGERPMSFHSVRQVRQLARGFKVELLRECVEDGMAFSGPKHWHYFDLILGKPPMARHSYD